MSLPQALNNSNLFKPTKLGSLELKNRLVLAPSTRFRNTSDHVATNVMKTFYEERATNNGGLLITEAVFVSPQAGYYPYAPMIYTDKQIRAWKQITDAVHNKGSKIALQLWHLGRLGAPQMLKAKGLPLLGASKIYESPESEKQAIESGNELKEMTIDDINQLKKEFVDAAKNSIEKAGFDLVEIHGATMYTLNQFLDPASNKRTDKYGGSIENRSRLMLEVVDEISNAVGAGKVGIRLSPYMMFQGSEGIASKIIHPIANYAYLISELEKRGREGKRIAYLHSIEPRIGEVEQNAFIPDSNPEWIEQIWTGVMIKNGSYLHDENYSRLVEKVDANDKTLVSSARYFAANPDLANRLKNGYPLNAYDRSTFYGGNAKGYIDYPVYGKDVDSTLSETKIKSL